MTVSEKVGGRVRVGGGWSRDPKYFFVDYCREGPRGPLTTTHDPPPMTCPGPDQGPTRPDPARPELVKIFFCAKRLGNTCRVPWSSRCVQVSAGRPRFLSRKLEIPAASRRVCLTAETSAFPAELEPGNCTANSRALSLVSGSRRFFSCCSLFLY